MNPIPFFRLPFLVIQEVFSMMSPFDIIRLARASRRSKQIVKTVINTIKKYHIKVYIADDYGIGFKNGTSGRYYMYTSKKGHECSTVGKFIDHEFSISFFKRKFTYHKLDAFKKIFNLCQDLFGYITSLHLNMNNDDNKLIIDYLKTKQEKFDLCEIYINKQKLDEINYFFDNIKIAKNLGIHYDIPEDFEMNLPENVEKLFVYDSNFIKVEQLLALKSKQISLYSTKFTNQDITTILRSWMASESNLNLEHLRIGFDSTTTEDILQDIPNEIGDGFQVYGRFGNLIPVPDGPDIKREDGKKARVIFGRSFFEMTLDMYVH